MAAGAAAAQDCELVDRSDDVRAARAPGPARAGDPAAADRDRPRRRSRYYHFAEGDGRRASRRSSRAPATPARTASSSSCAPDRRRSALARAHRGGQPDRASCPPASAPATRCASRRRCASTATTSTRPRRSSRRASAGSCRSTRPRATSSAARCSRRRRRTGAPRKLVGFEMIGPRHRAPRLPGAPGRRARSGAVTSGTLRARSCRRTSASCYLPAAQRRGRHRVRRRDPRQARAGPRRARRRSTSGQQADATGGAASDVSRRPAATRRTTSGSASRATAARVGITDYAQKQLGDVVFVELPEVGRDARRRARRFGTVESVKAVSELFSPGRGRGGRGQRGARRHARDDQHGPVRRGLDDRGRSSRTRRRSAGLHGRRRRTQALRRERGEVD